MILMYHKIDIVTPSRWWVSVETFERQVSDLLGREYEFVHLDDYELKNKNHVALTFDDAYENNYHHAFPFLSAHSIPFEIFLMGDLLGKWNDFDTREMKTRFCSLSHLKQMVDGGARLQWHTRTHAQLPYLSDAEISKELTVNPELADQFPAPHFNWFAYPSGMHDQRSVDIVSERFCGALSVDHGTDDDRFQLNRVTVDENWRLPGTNP